MEGDREKGRLPTFKIPRDLTLSAIKSSSLQQNRPRKNFVPNIPPKRDNNTPASSTTTTISIVPKEKETKQPLPTPPTSASTSNTPSSSTKNRKRDKKKPELVQASSIFSEGVGNTGKSKKGDEVKGSRGIGRGRPQDASSERTQSGRARLEKYSKEKGDKDSMPKNKSFQAAHLKVHETIGDGSFVDYSEDEDETDVSVHLDPVILPLSKYREAALVENPVLPVSIPLKVQSDQDVPIQNLSLETGHLTFEPFTFAHAINTAPPEGTLVFFQMPEFIPFLDPTSSKTSVDESSSPDKKEKNPEDVIDAIPEGCVGKIQILASGASRLVFGDNILDIETGKPVAFRQELSAIDLENKTMTNLGLIQQKFVCTVNLDNFFQQQEASHST